MNRRDFLSATSLGLGALSLPSAFGPTGFGPSAFGADDEKKTFRAGVIGTGWYGMVDLRHLMDVAPVEVVSLCDPDSAMLKAAADEVEKKQKGRPAEFADFRQMLKAKNLDLVIVGTPDHWHALTAIAAMEAGAHVYVEKPISHTFLEGRAMLDTARRLKRVVQVGTQRRSTPHLVQVKEFIDAGNLGKIGVARAYCYYNMRGNITTPDAEAPKGFDFDLWSGPAPLRKFNPAIHPKGWRNFTEYGSGIIGDMGVHMLDTMRWLVGVGWPKKVSSTGGIFVMDKGIANTPDTQTATFDYGDFTAIWEHRTWGRADEPKYGWGLNLMGEKGILKLTVEGAEFEPWGGDGKPVKFEAIRKAGPSPKDLEPDHIAPAGRGHVSNWFNCVKSEGRPRADIEEGHISTGMCHLANISQQTGRTLRWAPETETIIGDSEAMKLMRREYRGDWKYPVG